MVELIHKMKGPDGITRKILIGSRTFMESFLRTQQVSQPTMFISITTPGDEKVKIPKNKNIHVFRMQFHDADVNIDNINAPSAKDIAGLKTFIDKNKNIANIFIHCDAGYSRSPAVAWSICDYLQLTDINGDSFDKLAYIYYMPNMRVKRLCDAVLHGNPPEGDNQNAE